MKMISALFSVVISVAAITALAGPAEAASSPWVDTMGARLRMIAPGGPADETGAVRAGIEISLEDGWKTYWRNPGDAGLPPKFEFAGSTNIKNITVSYPFPKRDSDGYSTSMIYKHQVVFPVHITPADTSLPMILKLRADYGVCKDVCVPATAEVSMILSAHTAADDDVTARVNRAFADVPRPTAVGSDLSVVSVRPGKDAKSGKPVLNVTVRMADPASDHDLFVEGPLDWFLPAPERVSSDDAGAVYQVALDGLPKNTKLGGRDLVFTLVNNKRAVEQNWRLDVAP